MCHFRRFFGLFSKSRIEILLLKRQNVEEMDSEQMQKTAALILFKKSRYLTSKFVIDGPKSSISALFGNFLGKYNRDLGLESSECRGE